MLTKERIDELFSFNLESGTVTNKVKRNHSALGAESGCSRADGYRVIRIDDKLYLTSRIIWLHAYGEFPRCIDHINHVTSDNRLINLRNVTQSENLKNMSMRSNNTSGVMGVSWDKKMEKWVIRIRVGKKYKFLGYYGSLNEAAKVRKAAELKYGYHPNHGQIKWGI